MDLTTIPPEYRHFFDFEPSASGYVSPSEDPETGVISKDVEVSPDAAARIFLPKITKTDQKIPIIVYIHGGGFVSGSPFAPSYHSYMNTLTAEANAMAVSVKYRLLPECRIPDCYDDSWAVFKWVVSHAKDRQGPEPWINEHADFSRVYVLGESAGANIAHNVVARASVEELETGVKIAGMALVCPYFGDGNNPEKIWTYLGPENPRADDPRLCPMVDLNLLSKIVCSKILVCTAEKDHLRERGWLYYEALKKCGWGERVQYNETEGEDHCFHFKDPASEKAKSLMKLVTSFIN